MSEPKDNYPTLTWVEMESWHHCECGHPECKNEPYTKDNPCVIAAQCHKGCGVNVHYWDGFLYLSCDKCEKPICKIEVKKSLLV